jgi:hypothetical protein
LPALRSLAGQAQTAGTPSGPKFYIITDLEGPAGVDRWEQTREAGRAQDEAKALLTGEVNATVSGILDAEPQAMVDVWDGHGSGGLLKEKLHPKARYLKDENPRKAFCAFEFAYFARPDSRFDGKYVYEIREDFGRNIVREYPEVTKDADVILSVPETGDDPAMGVHEESGLRWERASRRHRYVTERAFILLNNERFSTIDRKVNILGSKVAGKRVIVTEDSIVRGDTTKVIIDKLRKAGAKKSICSSLSHG